MISEITAICISIFVYFPDNSTQTRLHYEKLIGEAFKTYEYIGVEYEYAECPNVADVIIQSSVLILHDGFVGYCNGSIKTNRKFQPQPEILISFIVPHTSFASVLRHELYHFLTGSAYHNEYDINSVMYPIMTGAEILSRMDSLMLSAHFLREVRVNYIVPQYTE